MREFKKIADLSNSELLEWYSTLTKASHYEAIDEFAFLKNAPWDLYELEEAILQRMSTDGD